MAAPNLEAVDGLAPLRDDLHVISVVYHACRRSRPFDRSEFFIRCVDGRLEAVDGFAVRPRIGARVDARDHNAVSLAIEQRQRIGQFRTGILEGVVTNESDAGNVRASQGFEFAYLLSDPLEAGLLGRQSGLNCGQAARGTRAAADQPVVDGKQRSRTRAAPGAPTAK